MRTFFNLRNQQHRVRLKMPCQLFYKNQFIIMKLLLKHHFPLLIWYYLCWKVLNNKILFQNSLLWFYTISLNCMQQNNNKKLIIMLNNYLSYRNIMKLMVFCKSYLFTLNSKIFLSTYVKSTEIQKRYQNYWSSYILNITSCSFRSL